MAKKAKGKNIVPHQELNEFLELLFGSDFSRPKEYYCEFNKTPSVYLSLNSRQYKNPNERDAYVMQLDRLYKNVVSNLGYQLRGLHVRTHSHNERFVYIHNTHSCEGFEKVYTLEYSNEFGLCNYFQCELPESRISDVLFGSCRTMIDTFDDIFADEGRVLLYVPLPSVHGMIFSKL